MRKSGQSCKLGPLDSALLQVRKELEDVGFSKLIIGGNLINARDFDTEKAFQVEGLREAATPIAHELSDPVMVPFRMFAIRRYLLKKAVDKLKTQGATVLEEKILPDESVRLKIKDCDIVIMVLP